MQLFGVAVVGDLYEGRLPGEENFYCVGGRLRRGSDYLLHAGNLKVSLVHNEKIVCFDPIYGKERNFFSIYFEW